MGNNSDCYFLIQNQAPYPEDKPGDIQETRFCFSLPLSNWISITTARAAQNGCAQLLITFRVINNDKTAWKSLDKRIVDKTKQ